MVLIVVAELRSDIRHQASEQWLVLQRLGIVHLLEVEVTDGMTFHFIPWIIGSLSDLLNGLADLGKDLNGANPADVETWLNTASPKTSKKQGQPRKTWVSFLQSWLNSLASCQHEQCESEACARFWHPAT